MEKMARRIIKSQFSASYFFLSHCLSSSFSHQDNIATENHNMGNENITSSPLNGISICRQIKGVQGGTKWSDVRLYTSREARKKWSKCTSACVLPRYRDWREKASEDVFVRDQSRSKTRNAPAGLRLSNTGPVLVVNHVYGQKWDFQAGISVWTGN